VPVGVGIRGVVQGQGAGGSIKREVGYLVATRPGSTKWCTCVYEQRPRWVAYGKVDSVLPLAQAWQARTPQCLRARGRPQSNTTTMTSLSKSTSPAWGASRRSQSGRRTWGRRRRRGRGSSQSTTLVSGFPWIFSKALLQSELQTQLGLLLGPWWQYQAKTCTSRVIVHVHSKGLPGSLGS
jgi:hypothetical protein